MPQSDEKAEAARKEDIDSPRKEGEGKSGSSKISPRSRSEESQRTTFTVLQKNMRSMSSNERLDELIIELNRIDWGRDTDLRNMAPKQRGLGDTARTHHG